MVLSLQVSHQNSPINSLAYLILLDYVTRIIFCEVHTCHGAPDYSGFSSRLVLRLRPKYFPQHPIITDAKA